MAEYASIPVTAAGGVGDITLTAENLPPGLTLTDNGDGTGVIAGTVTDFSDGVYEVVVRAEDTVGRSCREVFTFYGPPTYLAAVEAQVLARSPGLRLSAVESQVLARTPGLHLSAVEAQVLVQMP